MSVSTAAGTVVDELQARFSGALLPQATQDGIPTLWVSPQQIKEVLTFLKTGISRPYQMLFDLTGIDERERVNRQGQPDSDFTVVYELNSIERNSEVRIKVPLQGDEPHIPSIVDIWPSANWYEREAWDMFGIVFDGHPFLRRILMPSTWKGHPLRKDHPARGTEIGPAIMDQVRELIETEALKFDPEDWGMKTGDGDTQYLFLNLGPQHPGTHGPFRIVLALDGEEIVDAVPEIGFHHRADEKMGERQSWHTYIPYCDRVDYLSGVLNELPYCLSVEKLAGIDIPPRAMYIRIMMAELFRIISHLVYLGTFAQDLGAMSPVFYMFTDREKAFKLVEAVTGARMHPVYFRIGGVREDLPNGWEALFNDFLEYLPRRLDEYDTILMNNPIFRGRTVGVGKISREEAIEWGVTGPFLRSTGLAYDLRKLRPYAGYDQFDFEVVTGTTGDCFDRAQVHMEEMRQSLRIIRQCIVNMPDGPYKSLHPLATPPLKPRTMQDIETLINHFVHVSWGPVIPPGEVIVPTESSKGIYGYYVISDNDTIPYRVRIRTASFPHVQTIPMLANGLMIPDLLAILGSIDFVLSDVDR